MRGEDGELQVTSDKLQVTEQGHLPKPLDTCYLRLGTCKLSPAHLSTAHLLCGEAAETQRAQRTEGKIPG